MNAALPITAPDPVVAAEGPPAATRSLALDCAKGAAMIGVVASHVMRGLEGDGLLAAGPVYRLIDNGLYLFHVQLFLLIGGYLAYPRARDARWQRGRLVSLGYSYLLWSALSLTALVLAHRPTGFATPAAAYAGLLYAPIQHFWFLPVVMIGGALLMLLRPPLAIVAMLGVCALFRSVTQATYYALDYYLFFFLAGALLRAMPIRLDRPAMTAAVCAILYVAAMVWITALPLPATIPPSIPASMCACYAVYFAAGRAARVPWLAAALALCGTLSLPIYLTHVFFTAGLRAALAGQPVPVTVSLALGILVGIGGPILFYRAAVGLGLSRAAGLDAVLK